MFALFNKWSRLLSHLTPSEKGKLVKFDHRIASVLPREGLLLWSTLDKVKIRKKVHKVEGKQVVDWMLTKGDRCPVIIRLILTGNWEFECYLSIGYYKTIGTHKFTNLDDLFSWVSFNRRGKSEFLSNPEDLDGVLGRLNRR